MSQRPKRAAKRHFADHASPDGAYDALDDDGNLDARGDALDRAAGAAGSDKRPRREGAGRKGLAARREADDDEAASGGESASQGSEDVADHDMSDDGDDGLGEEDEPRRGGRGGAGAARGRRGGSRGGGRAGRADAGAAHGRSARGGRGGGGSAAAGGAAGAASDDSDVVIISSDSDDGAAGAQAGASMAPPAAAAGGRGGRGAARGRGRGRGRGASQPAPAGADDGNGSDDDAERDGGGQAGGSGGAAGRGTQAQARQGAAARFASATEPLQIDSKELAAMRRKIKRYHEEYQDAAAKCDVWNEVSNATKQELARVVVRYMLFAARAKPGVPVARGKLTDAIKKALGNQRHHRKLASVWLPWARHMAISTLGMDIDDLAPRPEPKMGAGGAAATAAGASCSADDVPAAPAAPVTAAAALGNQHFVLRTALPTVLRLQVVGQGAAPGEGGDDWALTSVVLALIRVNNNKMEETQLKRLLDQLGFQEGQPHPVLGSLDAQLKRMMDQRYIVADRNTTMQADGRHERLLLWGDAALSETGPKAIDDMIESWFELKESAAATADDEEGAAGAADADQQ